jgi:AcrR family transcriptional regulator
MASRKAKPREKKPARQISARAAGPLPTGDGEVDDRRPSSTMTREVEIATLGNLLESAGDVEAARGPAIPPPPTTRVLDDLAQTTEAPSASRILLLDAGEVVFSELGYARTTDAEIARAAAVSLDVFHAHFASKTALLHALSDRFCSQAMTVTNDATKSGIGEHATPREVVEVAVRSMLDIILGRAGLVRAVLTAGDDTMLDGFRRVGINTTEKVLRVLEETHADGEMATKPEPRDVAFALHLAIAIAHHAIMVGIEWCGRDFERDEIYERVTHAVSAYLESAHPG